MNLSVHWDIKDLLQAADRMALQNYLPEFIAKTVAVSMRDLAIGPYFRQQCSFPSSFS